MFKDATSFIMYVFPLQKLSHLSEKFEVRERETTEAKENVEILKESLAKQQSLTEKGIIL